MGGIFISYRRVDTIAWAGRLFADLAGRFNVSQVFMDINGGIPRGAQFEDVLRNALTSCDALLVLIGPQWVTCKRSEKQRRLDMADDWVRNEIVTALGRNIVVVPVLLGQAALPEEADLPEDLRPLCRRQAAEVLDNRWDYDVGELIKDLLKLTSLKIVGDDVASADSGIRALKELILKVPAVADAVSRSKEVIENTQRQVNRLELFKSIHDSLHKIEFDCLRPMQAGASSKRLRPFKIGFSTEARRIQETAENEEISPALRDDLIEQLDCVAAAFQTGVDSPSDAAYAQVVAELNVLLSGLPSRLDSAIADAAAELNLNRLVELMMTVRTKLPASQSGDSELDAFINGIDALNRLREELERRVSEHTQLQRLDSKLRTVSAGSAAPGMLASEWARMKLVRARLKAPFSPEMEGAITDLVALEAEIEDTLLKGNESEASALLNEYFRSISSVFRDVDTSLRGFCERLSAVNEPLRMILSTY